MHFTEEEAANVKTWVIKRLEDMYVLDTARVYQYGQNRTYYMTCKLTLDFFSQSSSDADSDVLADYVLALIRSDAPDEEIRQASIENLEDFLKESKCAVACSY